MVPPGIEEKEKIVNNISSVYNFPQLIAPILEMSKELIIASAVVILIVGAYLLIKNQKSVEKFQATAEVWVLSINDGTPCGKLVDYYATSLDANNVRSGYVYGAQAVGGNSMNVGPPGDSTGYIAFARLNMSYTKYTLNNRGGFSFTSNGQNYDFNPLSSLPATCPRPVFQ